MADKTQNRIVPKEDGKYYSIESSFDNGKTWHSSGSSSPTQEGAQKIVDNWAKGLTSEGLTKEEAQAKADAAPGPKLTQADPSKTKTVLSQKEAAKAGVNTGKLPTQFQLDHPILSGSFGNVSDENGWIDDDGQVHLNSRATEARAKNAESDKAVGRDYKTAKAPSAYELDLRKKNLSGTYTDGSFVHDDQDLQNIIAKYSESDPELAKAAQKELDSRNAGMKYGGISKKQGDLGGRTTEEWVAWMKSRGYSDEEIAAAYEEEGYSRNGAKFQAAMSKQAGTSKGTDSNTDDSADTSATREAFDQKADLADEMNDKYQGYIDKLNDYLTENNDKIDGALEKKRSLKQLRDTLPKMIISAYKEGDFGDLSDPKEKAAAKRTMGYFIMDALAKGLSNAGSIALQVAGKGDGAQQSLAWTDYRKKLSDTGIETTFDQRKQANTAGVNLIEEQGKKYLDLEGKKFDITSSGLDKAVSKFGDNIDQDMYLKRMNQDSKYLENMSEQDKARVAALNALMSQDADKNLSGLASVQKSRILYENNKNNAEAQKELISVQQAYLQNQLTGKQLSLMDTQIKQAAAQYNLTQEQTNLLKQQVQGAIIDNGYKGAEHVQKIISGYVDTISKGVDAILPDELSLF